MLGDNHQYEPCLVKIFKERTIYLFEVESKCACSITYLHKLVAADQYLHAVICR